jgi:hypothetical protein
VITPPAPLAGIGGHHRCQPLPFLISQVMPIQAIIHRPDLHQPEPKIYRTRQIALRASLRDQP